jgi:acetoin utilization protein AcuB
MLVGRHMTHNVITATPRTTHREALDLLHKHKIRRLPILDNERLVGIVGEKDLLSTAPSPATSLSVYEIYTLLDKLVMSKIMTRPVITVGPECPLQDAAQIMIEKKIGCLPVMRATDLVGIITETDIMRVLVGMLGGGLPGIHFTVRLKNEPGALAAVLGAVAKAGGNTVSVVTFRPSDNGMGEAAIKEQGADQELLRRYVHEVNAEIVDIQNGTPHQPKLFG